VFPYLGWLLNTGRWFIPGAQPPIGTLVTLHQKCCSFFDLQAIRVIANLSINTEAGAGVAANEPLVDLLIQILGRLMLNIFFQGSQNVPTAQNFAVKNIIMSQCNCQQKPAVYNGDTKIKC